MAEFKLPDVGEGLTEAEIVSWKVKVGDVIEINDIIVEIETAKSLVELPSPYAGTVQALLVPEGETVAVGTPIISDRRPSEAAPRPPRRPRRRPYRPPQAEMEIDLSNPARLGGGEGESLVGRNKADRGRPPRPQGRPRRATEAGAGAARCSSRARSSPVGASPHVEGPTSRRCRRPRPGPVPARDAHALVPGRPRRPRPGAGQAAGAQAGQGPRRRPRALTPTGPAARSRGRRRAAAAAAGRGRPVGGRARRDHRPRGGGERETREPIKGVRKMMAQAMVSSAFTAPHVTEWVTVDVTRTMEFVDRLKARREFRDVKVSPLLVLAAR